MGRPVFGNAVDDLQSGSYKLVGRVEISHCCHCNAIALGTVPFYLCKQICGEYSAGQGTAWVIDVARASRTGGQLVANSILSGGERYGSSRLCSCNFPDHDVYLADSDLCFRLAAGGRQV